LAQSRDRAEPPGGGSAVADQSGQPTARAHKPLSAGVERHIDPTK
jgi:hypothetical protein